MSTLKKDKQKVLDEVWTEDRVKSFLDLKPPFGFDPDYHCLIKAYQSMKLEDFEKFIGFFVAANRNLNARNEQGETLLNIISKHRHGTGYADVLKKSGASL